MKKLENGITENYRNSVFENMDGHFYYCFGNDNLLVHGFLVQKWNPNLYYRQK